MTPILITVIQMILLYIPTLSDVCLWGRTGSNSILNGLYVEQGTLNGYPFYIFNSGCDALYILWTGSRLEISTNLNSGSSMYGYCGNGATDPNACNSWYIYSSGSFQIDSNVYTISDSCPSWDCDQVSAPTLTNGCGGTYDEYIGVNAWRSSSNGMYWYFDPYYFNWICTDEYFIDCYYDQYYYAATEEGWIDLAKGESTQLDFVYPQDYTRDVNCIKNPTPAPTKKPTTSTTTTRKPTTSTTTINPTSAPTINPTTSTTTKKPTTSTTTQKPTTSTTTFNPTLAPTKEPTVAPTNNPTISTTINVITSTTSNKPARSTTVNNPDPSTTINPVTSTADNNPIKSTRNTPITSTANNPITSTTINPITSTAINLITSKTINTAAPSTTINPTLSTATNSMSNRLIVPIQQTSDKYAEGAALQTTATTQNQPVQNTQIAHESENGSFWTIFAVLISVISVAIICLCIVMVYKYKQNKAMNDIEMVKKSDHENMPKIAELEYPVRINSISQYIENNDDEKQGVETVVNYNPSSNVKFGENKDEDLTVSVDYKGTQSSHDQISFNVNMFNTPGDDRQIYIDALNGNHDNVAALNDDYTPNNDAGIDGESDNEDIGRVTGESDEDNNDELERNRGNTMGNDNNYDDNNNNNNNDMIIIYDDDRGKDLLREWLKYKVKLPDYFDNFVENGYENLDIIKEITERDELVEIGIVLKGHITKIMAEIKALNKNIIEQ